MTWASCSTRWWATVFSLAEHDMAFSLQIIWASAGTASRTNVLMELSAGRHMRGASHGTRWWSMMWWWVCRTQQSLVLALQFIAAGGAAPARSDHTPELIAAGMMTWASCSTRWWATVFTLAEHDM